MTLPQCINEDNRRNPDSPASLDEIHNELVSIKYSIESIEQMVKCACQMAIVGAVLGASAIFWYQLF